MNVPMLLAVDISDVLWVLFVLVAMVSGIINKFKENKAAEEVRQRRAQRGGVQGREQVQDEISVFLEELGSDTPARKPRPEQRTRRERAQQQRRPKRRQNVAEREASDRSARQRSRPSGSKKRLEHEVGTMKDRHMQSAVQERHLQSHVGDHQPGTLAESLIEAPESRADAIAVAGLPPVAQLLARRDGLANAIMLNEILSPPVSRRANRRD